MAVLRGGEKLVRYIFDLMNEVDERTCPKNQRLEREEGGRREGRGQLRFLSRSHFTLLLLT